MIERTIAADVPFAWVAGDSVYGVSEIEMALHRAYKGYVLGVTGQHPFWSWGVQDPVSGTAADIAAALAPSDWIRLSAGAGSKGQRLYNWAYLELATLPAATLDPALDESLWTRGLLIRRSLADASLAFFSTRGPAGTPIETLVAVEGRCWAIEDAFETAKTELGLTHNETRSWHGWHRHVSLVMLAFAMLAAVRYRANSLSPPKAAQPSRSAAGPLVGPGDEAHRHAPGPAPDPIGLRHRLVCLAKSPSSRRSNRARQTQGATVMLGGR